MRLWKFVELDDALGTKLIWKVINQGGIWAK